MTEKKPETYSFEYNYDQEELNAVTGLLLLIREELIEVLPAEAIEEMQRGPYDVCVHALSFIQNAKKIRAQDMGLDKPEVTADTTQGEQQQLKEQEQ